MYDVLKSQGQKLIKGGKTVESDDENLAELREIVCKFQAGLGAVLPILKVR